MSIIGDFIEDLSKNQEDEYIYFIKGIRDAQPFAFLSALAFSLSIFAYSYSPKEVSIYAALAGISFLLAFISLLSFRFIKPNFGLFLFLSYIYTIIGVGFFLSIAIKLCTPENFGEMASWVGLLMVFQIILLISYFGYRNSNVGRLFKIGVLMLFGTYFIGILYALIRLFVLIFIKFDINDFAITGYFMTILAIFFMISLIFLPILILMKPKI